MKKSLTQVSQTLLRGRITELMAVEYFLHQGFNVSVPEVPCQYDLILDTGTKLLKLQVKTCRLSENEDYISFNTSSTTHNSEGYVRRVYSSDMVDYFCTVYKGVCYLVPLSKCGSKEKRLRLVPTKNGQTKNITFAKDCEAMEVLKGLESE